MRDKTLIGHLDELRRRLLVCIGAVIAGGSVCYLFINHILEFLNAPMASMEKTLVAITPTEKFVSLLEIAVLGGIFIASPVILWQVWRFILPALEAREARYILPLFFAAPLFFMLGASFAFYLIIPLALRFLLGLAPGIEDMISFARYINFTAWLLFSFGLVFELPLVIMALARLGLITPGTLKEKRRYVIVGIFILAAILTPPDIFTQILLACPMILLYELSIIVAGLVERRAK